MDDSEIRISSYETYRAIKVQSSDIVYIIWVIYGSIKTIPVKSEKMR